MPGETVAERRKKVLLGDLPDDFLRLTLPSSSQTQSPPVAVIDPRAQIQFVQQYPYSFVPPNTRGRLSATIIEANLVKNYGLVRMDPYCRIRVGEAVFETPTKISGGRQPVWNRIVHAYLPNNVESIYVQIYDERAFSKDECIAWAHIMLPDSIFVGEAIDDWYTLSGPQGETKEGMIHIIFSFQPLPTPQAPQQAAIPARVEISEDDVKELQEMFSGIDADVIKCVLEQNNGDKNATCNALIELSS